MRLYLLPPLHPSNSKSDAQFKRSGCGKLTSSSRNSEVATEAALHRRKLSELRQEFLGTLTPFGPHPNIQPCEIQDGNSYCEIINSEPNGMTSGSVSGTLQCDQIDTVAELPTSDYFSFVYSNPMISYSMTPSADVRTSLKSAVPALRPEWIHLPSEECVDSSTSSDSSKSYDYIATPDYSEDTVLCVPVVNVVDMKRLSEKCSSQHASKQSKAKALSYKSRTKYPPYSCKFLSPKHEHKQFNEIATKSCKLCENVTVVSQAAHVQMCNVCPHIDELGVKQTESESESNESDSLVVPDMFHVPIDNTNVSYNITNQHAAKQSSLEAKSKHHSPSLSAPSQNIIHAGTHICTEKNLHEITESNSLYLTDHFTKHSVSHSQNANVKVSEIAPFNHISAGKGVVASMSNNILTGTTVGIKSDTFQHCLGKMNHSLSQFNTHLSRVDCSLERLENIDKILNNYSDIIQQINDKCSVGSCSLHKKKLNNDLKTIAAAKPPEYKPDRQYLRAEQCADGSSPILSRETSLSSLPSVWSSLCQGDSSVGNLDVNAHSIRLKQFGIPLPGLASSRNQIIGQCSSTNVFQPSEYPVKNNPMINKSSSQHLINNLNDNNFQPFIHDQYGKNRSGNGATQNKNPNGTKTFGRKISPSYTNTRLLSRTSDLSSSEEISESSSIMGEYLDSQKVSKKSIITPIISREPRSLTTSSSNDSDHFDSIRNNGYASISGNNEKALMNKSKFNQKGSKEKGVKSCLALSENHLKEGIGEEYNFDNKICEQSSHYSSVANRTHSKNHEISRLVMKLTRYLQNGQETEARRLLGKMLAKPESRRQIEALIDLCGNKLRRVLGPHASTKATLDDNSIPPLLHLAASLSDLRTSYLPSDFDCGLKKVAKSRRRGSSGSLLSVPHTLPSSYPPWAHTENNWNPSTHSIRHSSLQEGNNSPIYSSDSVHFVKWPSGGCIDIKPPPLPPVPSPLSPVLLKSEILPSDERMHLLDFHALETTKNIHLTFGELLKELLCDLTNEVEIIRSLFRWTTGKQLYYEDYDLSAPPNSLIGMLRQVKYNQLTRNELFHELCRYVGIHCQYVTGYSKGAGYRPGMQIKNNRLFRNTWLSVYICDGWRFINCNWAARYLTEMNYTTPNRYPDCDEFYFLTDPDQHIFESFPDLKVWQLLRKPLNMERFCRLPLLKSPFFNANLSLKKNYSHCLVTKNGQVSVKLKMSKFVGISCSLENCADHNILLGLCLVEILLKSPDIVRIQAAPSQPGNYYLNIYVSPDWRREDLRELACSFEIQCSEFNYSRLIVTGRLPEVGFLGRTPAAQIHGIMMIPEGVASSGRPYIVHTDTKPLEIPFAIAPGLKICHQLKSFDRPGQQMVDCDSYALLQMKPYNQNNNKDMGTIINAHYCIRIPVQAFYYLTVYASNLLGSQSDHLECVYRILIDARKSRPVPDMVPAFPRQTFWWVQCRLIEPSNQHLEVDRRYTFRLDAPQCDSVAVVINESQWNFLIPSSNTSHPGRWTGKVDVGKCLGQLSVFGRIPRIYKTIVTTDKSEYDSGYPINQSTDGGEEKDSKEDENSYIKLLDYVLVSKKSN